MLWPDPLATYPQKMKDVGIMFNKKLTATSQPGGQGPSIWVHGSNNLGVGELPAWNFSNVINVNFCIFMDDENRRHHSR
uniref:Uncharacterized protein n=1 Tax=Romanomermis culicivorax TaxID=13658 RepID=A0A915IJY1_ROMCU